ncbi:hypothetical protein ACF0H5_010261 [Mactra antiquata]
MSPFIRRLLCGGLGVIICVIIAINQKSLNSASNNEVNVDKVQLGVQNVNKDITNIENKNSVGTKSTYLSGLAVWTVLLAVNDAFFDFFSNWFFYYTKLKLNLPIVIMAEDEKVYTKLKSVCSYCQILRSGLNLHEAFNYNSANFIKLMSQRPSNILRLLRDGKNVLHVDVDSVWLHNPLPHLDMSVDVTYQLDGPNNVCMGFIAIKSNNRTIELVEQWRKRMSQKPKQNDQETFNSVLQNNKGSIRHQGLDAMQFPNGRQYFVDFNRTQRSRVVIVHNNYIIGHDTKKERFQKFGLWVLLI